MMQVLLRSVLKESRNKVFITIHAAKPGIIIGRGGAEIDKLKAQNRKAYFKDC